MSKERPNKNPNRKRNKLMDLSKINDFRLDLAAITPELIINILTKQPSERELQDYSILNDYILFLSKLTDKFRSQKIPQSVIEKIVLLSLPSSKLKVFIASKSQIYTPDTEANYIYIILKGTVKLIKVHKQLIRLKSYDYYQLIINLRNKKEEYLLNHTLNENSAIFPVDLSDIDILDKILLKILLINRKAAEDDYDYLDKSIKKVGLTYAELGLTCSFREQLEEKNHEIQLKNIELIKSGMGVKCKELISFNIKEARAYALEQEKKVYEQLNFINFDICQKYIYFIYDSEEFITTFELVQDKIVKTNDFFGEYFGNKYLDFAESAENDVYLLMIKNNMINQILNNEKDKISTNQADFLINNFFFRSIKRFIFERYFLNYFELENYRPGQKICDENESVKYLYFIRKGRVRLTYKKSILEVHSLINIIKEQIKQKKFEEGDHNESEIIKFLENNSNNYNLKGNFESIKKELNNKQDRNIMVYQENQCLGYESYYYGLKYLYTAIAASDNVEVYKISVTQLAKIFTTKNEKCYSDLAKRAEEALFFLMKRFIKLNNLLMDFYEKRKLAEEEDEKNQTKQIVNPRRAIFGNNANKRQNKKSIVIKKSEISRILPNLIKKAKAEKSLERSYINNGPFSMYKKLPTVNNYETSDQSSTLINISEYERNFFNDKGRLPMIEKNEKLPDLKKHMFYQKLNHNKKKLYLTSSRAKLNHLTKSRENSVNSSLYDNSKTLKDSKISHMSSIPLRKSNFIIEPRLLEDDSDERKTGGRFNNQSALFPLKQINNKKKIIGGKLQNFIKIKKKLIIKKNKIYKDQKDRLKLMVNNFTIEE